MNIYVLLASGETDTWQDAGDAVDDRGSLVVLGLIDGDEVPGDMKTMVISTEIPNEPFNMSAGGVGKVAVPEPTIKSQTFQVMAIYAPGMWMKVEFE